MIAKDLINYSIPPLRLTDDVSKAIHWMEELHLKQLPVLEEKEFKGFIDEATILNLKNVYEKVGDYELVALDCITSESQHYYDVVRLAYENESSLVAVIENDEYQGVISVQDVIEAFAQTASINSPGGILVLKLKQIDYSLAEISRLIESENVKILSSYVSSDENDPTSISLTLKLNTEDMSRVTATLRRFEYLVEEHSSDSDGDDKERLEILLKYLKI